MVIHIAECSGTKKLSALHRAVKYASEENAWIAVDNKETALLAWLMAKEIGVKIPYPIVSRKRRLQCISYTVGELVVKQHTF